MFILLRELIPQNKTYTVRTVNQNVVNNTKCLAHKEEVEEGAVAAECAAEGYREIVRAAMNKPQV